MRICGRCRLDYPEEFFRSHRPLSAVGGSSQRRHYVCIGCELTERTGRKLDNRPREKARRTLQAHADKYRRRSLADSREDFATRYGWDLDQMAHDIAHAHANGCPYCLTPFASMDGGLSAVTLDVIHPDLPPYYRTNTRWVCATCNRQKQRTPPDRWGERLRQWQRWEENQRRLKADPWSGTLFEGVDVLF